ncbi:MAG: hydroxymethylbilane synthase [Proteobacteria bacterium]|nr:hydroxymethylbilane synthase [Pseudomonadota bacterium]
MSLLQINVATRASKLALAQTNLCLNKLSSTKDVLFKIFKQNTAGDIRSMENKVQFDKANFVEDIEESLLSGKADIAIHSLKDMPAQQNMDLQIIALITHQHTNDLLIFPENEIKELKTDSLLGTSSLRRKYQCIHFLNHNNLANINGNIDTRLRKLEQKEYQAIILAQAGIDRLNLNVNCIALDENTFLPATGQGVIAIQCRKKDKKIEELCSQITNKSDIAALELERSVIKGLEADCNSAIGIKYVQKTTEQRLKVQVLSKDQYIELDEVNDNNNAEKFIELSLEKLHKMGAHKLLHEDR